MAKRTGLRFPLIKESSDGTWVGHPCGPIATTEWLSSRPKISKKVSRYLTGDAGGSLWNWSSFACELHTMQSAGCKLDSHGRKLVKRWVRAGKPAPWIARNMGLSDEAIERLDADGCACIGATM